MMETITVAILITVSSTIAITFPGTKWCGPGHVAEHYDDLGSEVNEDRCCRAHDNCNDSIPAHQTKYNITNPSPITRLHCDCDEEFSKCLEMVNSQLSEVLLQLYFRMSGTKCFREDFPVVGCKKTTGTLVKRCVEFEYNDTQTRSYQWLDSSVYFIR